MLQLAVATIVVACSRSSSKTERSSSSTVADTAVATASPSGAAHGVATAGPIVPVSGASATNTSSSTARTDDPCPRTGLWATCSVEKRLTQAGFVVRRAEGPTRRAGFAVAPAAYTLGRSRLEVFIYPSQRSADADAAALDTVYAAPRGTTNPRGVPPTFVRNANLLAVFLTENPTQAERLTLALTAGAPQP